MRLQKNGSSPKQLAYAMRTWGGQGVSKRSIALDVGYPPNIANSVSSHIEKKAGFQNAMAALARDSNNLALAAMSEFKARGFEGFSNKELIGALNAIGNAWTRFNTVPNAREKNRDGNNKLRTVILQQVENQTVVTDKEEKEQPIITVEDDPLDF